MDAGLVETGGSQPHLFEADDGKEYMVKAMNQPQNGRILPNELLAGLAMDWLGLSHPAVGVIDLQQELLAASPGAQFTGGTSLAAGLAFASEFWPSQPMGSVDISLASNLSNIAGTLVFDTWIRNHDGRQFRLAVDKAVSGRFRFFPIDQGHCFGPNWTPDSLGPAHDAIGVPAPLCHVPPDDIHPFCERLQAFDQDAAQHLVDQIPLAWLDDQHRTAVREYMSRRAPLAVDAIFVQYPKA